MAVWRDGSGWLFLDRVTNCSFYYYEEVHNGRLKSSSFNQTLLFHRAGVEKKETGAIAEQSSISTPLSQDEDFDLDDRVTLPSIGEPEDAGTDSPFETTVTVPCRGQLMTHPP